MASKRRILLAAMALGWTLAVGAAEQSSDEVDLFRAIQLDNVSGVKSLLKRGISPNVREPGGETALIVAMRYEAYRVATLLMDQPGIDLEARAPNGNTALMMAAFRQSRAVVLDMLARGARINQPGWNALHYAAAAGSTEIAGILLERHAAIDAVTPSGMTALMVAAREGQEQVVLLLLKQGADARLKDGGFHQTAAEFALQADKPWITRAIEAHLAAQVQR